MMMGVYYNEFDHFAVAWLRELIRAGFLPAGDVDDRDIREVKPDDIRGYTQCHFFAGIGGWSEAIRIAGWPADRNVWTGSCPCQPFSTAGNQKGKSDERHLWPVWFNLIRECKPSVVFGEQVAAAITHGWWDDVASDLESEGYACAAAVLPACSVGKPHKRDRLWFVGNSKYNGQPTGSQLRSHEEAGNKRRKEGADIPRESEGASRSAYVPSVQGVSSGEREDTSNVAYAPGQRLPNSDREGNQGHEGYECDGEMDWIICPDGKQRAVKPGVRLLVDGFPNRVGILRGFGNAIVPQAAAEFIKAFMELS